MIRREVHLELTLRVDVEASFHGDWHVSDEDGIRAVYLHGTEITNEPLSDALMNDPSILEALADEVASMEG